MDKEYKYSPKNKVNDETQKETFRYRLKMSKTEEMRYTSHLDWQNTIIKMMYRSGLNLAYTQGYNPSPKFSLGVPLPIFAESKCEFVDIDLCDDIEEEKLKGILNGVLPEHIRVEQVNKIAKKQEAIDVLTQWAEYEISSLKENVLKNEDLLYIKDNISSDNDIFIEKINKKGIKKLVNIKPSIKSAEVEGEKLLVILKTGKSDEIPALRPDDLIKLYNNDEAFKIVRTAFFDKNMNRL